MTGSGHIFAMAIRHRRITVFRARAIHTHRHCRLEASDRTRRPRLKNESEDEKKGREQLHLACLRVRNGQRMNRRIVPAIPSASPPTAKAKSQGVLKSSWFFQSMMWRLQKKS